MAEKSLAVVAGKKCPKCKEHKPAELFYRNCRDGLSPYCKPCSAEYKRRGARTQAEILASVYIGGKKRCSCCGKTKGLSHFNTKVDGRPKSRCKECQYEQFKQWVARRRAGAIQKNIPLPKPEPLPLVVARYGDDGVSRLCPACGVRRDHAYFGKGRSAACSLCLGAQARARCVRRRARKAGAGGSVSAKEWRAILDKYDNKCLCCGSTENLTMDHVIPLAKGGSHTPGNIQPLCLSCNSRKYTKVIDYRQVPK